MDKNQKILLIDNISVYFKIPMTSSSNFIESVLNSSINRPDPDTETKVRSSIRFLNDAIQFNANEPSLAFYRIQVNKSKINFSF